MLTGEETERYARQIVLREVGAPGQQKIKAARVLVNGAGGLGSPVLEYLAAAGVGTIGIVDDDRVARSNLQRQVIHGTPDIGRRKVESAHDAIARLNPNVAVEPHAVRLTHANARAIVAAYDVVVDATDNFPTRFAIADACAAEKKPLVTAAVLTFHGWLTVLKPYETGPDGSPNPSLRGIMAEPDDQVVPTCAEVGILGAVSGVLGTLAATEVLKIITGTGTPLVRRMLTLDLLDMSCDILVYEDATQPPRRGSKP